MEKVDSQPQMPVLASLGASAAHPGRQPDLPGLATLDRPLIIEVPNSQAAAVLNRLRQEGRLVQAMDVLRHGYRLHVR